jgi:hypothetical protein
VGRSRDFGAERLVNGLRGKALDLASRGWPVIPLRPRGKTPLTSHGHKDASCDPSLIAAWWGRWPHANIAIATGEPAGVVVLDVDPRNGGDESLFEFESAHGPLPSTPCVKTGGGGQHYYFRHPGVRVPCSAGLLGPGLDVKSDGGYVITPASVHPNGRAYEWDVAPDEVSLAVPPPALVTNSPPPRPVSQTPESLTDDFLSSRPPVEYVRVLAGVRARTGATICCPLPDHEDRTPSFHIYSTAEQGWFCFGCRRGGGIYQLAALLAGLSLPVRGREFLAVEAALTDIYLDLLGVA